MLSRGKYPASDGLLEERGGEKVYFFYEQIEKIYFLIEKIDKKGH
jgi:hypothetical protein